MFNRPQFMMAHLCSQDRTWSSPLGQEFARRYPQAYQRYAKTDKLWRLADLDYFAARRYILSLFDCQ